MDADEEALQMFAAGDASKLSEWPQLSSVVISRLEKIVHNDFIIPIIPPTPPPPEPRLLAPLPPSDPIEPEPPSTTDAQPSASPDGDKENAVPTPPYSDSPPIVAPVAAAPLQPGALPPKISSMLAEITSTLESSFPSYPPHTIQRLSELILMPRQHYRTLGAYLHAVDRVVHVTSGADVYPLPPALPDLFQAPNGITGFHGASPAEATALALRERIAVDSDEALGGALLSPIPWLSKTTNGAEGSSPLSATSSEGESALSLASSTSTSSADQAGPRRRRPFDGQVRTEHTETVEGPNGMGSIETVSVSVNGIPSMGAQHRMGVTQGEILRQEQQTGAANATNGTGHAATTTPSIVAVTALPASASTPSTLSSVPTNTLTPSTAMDSSDDDEGATILTPEGTPTDHGSEMEDDVDDIDNSNNEDIVDEQVPHARGPDIIGAADMGPQSATTSVFHVSGAEGVPMHGIDVEAAVGRKAEPLPMATSTATSLLPAADPQRGTAVSLLTEAEKDKAAGGEEHDDDKEEEKDADEEEKEEKDDMPKEEKDDALDEQSTTSPTPSAGKRPGDVDMASAEDEQPSQKKRKESDQKDADEPKKDGSEDTEMI